MPGTVAAGWGGLKADLRRRTFEPLRHVSFVCYFLVAVAGVGALGIWVELINLCLAKPPLDPSALRTAIATFFPALVGSTCFQVVLGRYLKALQAAIFLATSILLAIAGWLISAHSLSFTISLPIAVLASLVSLWLWWIANADNPDLADEALVDAPTGGAVGQTLSGNLEGFQS